VLDDPSRRLFGQKSPPATRSPSAVRRFESVLDELDAVLHAAA